MLFGSVSFFRDVFQKVLEGRTDDMTWKDRYIYFFRSLASVSFRKPKAFYNMFYGPHSEELGRIMRVYFNQLYPEELNGIDAGFAQVMREGILVNKYRLLFTNLLREENYTEEVEEITPVLLNSLYHTFLHEAIKRGRILMWNKRPRIWFFVKFWGAKVSMHSWRGHALNTVRVLFRCVC